MEITESKFVKGFIGDDYNLQDGLPHVSFFGRSNVGKSSMINSLVGKKNLVKTSKKPGKTREANFFLINNSFYIVDFPGYGYAKIPLSERNKMAKRILWYLESSKNKPRAIFLIIDIKVGLTDLDRQMIKNIKINNHKLFLIANKIDKISKTEIEKQISLIKEEFKNTLIFRYSTKKNTGKEKILSELERIFFCS